VSEQVAPAWRQTGFAVRAGATTGHPDPLRTTETRGPQNGSPLLFVQPGRDLSAASLNPKVEGSNPSRPISNALQLGAFLLGLQKFASHARTVVVRGRE
jgi:hypothetical protein